MPFEQILNARYLQRLGYGAGAEELTMEALGMFLERIPDCARALAGYARGGNRSLLARLDEVLLRAQRRDPPEA